MKLLSSRFWGKMRRLFVILSGSTRNIGRIVLVVLVRSFCVDVAVSWLTFLFNGKGFRSCQIAWLMLMSGLRVICEPRMVNFL